MSHISKPVDWEVFNIPSVQPVQYYSILKKKREISQLIKQYDTQVLKHGYLHYCGIVPKNISSSFNNRYEIVIVFFDEIPNTSFIGFKVNASRETFTYESNSLLLFLKKTNKTVFYLMNNNYIHVQCGTNAWELFYLLYDNYLRRYVLTIIGTQFFYHFVYSHCIQNERQLLEVLYKGSKVIRVSKNSIYYKMHRKRKISVTDLIYMTVNMPKSKRYIISCFSSKESRLYSNMNEGDFYTADGSKINVSKLVLKKFKKEFQNTLPTDSTEKYFAFGEIPAATNPMFYPYSESKVAKLKLHKSNMQLTSHTTLKRKFEDLGNSHDIEPGPSTSKIFKTTKLNSCNEICENQWKEFTNLKPYTVKHYSGIPCISQLVPNLLSNGQSSDFVNSNSYLRNTDLNVSVLQLIKLNEENKNNSILKIEEMSKNNDHINSSSSTITSSIKTAEVIFENESLFTSKKSFDLKTHVDSVTPKNSFPTVQKSDESHSCLDISILDCSHKISTPPLKKGSKNINQGYSSFAKDVSFTTAAGKNIDIPDTAMLTAHKLIQGVISDRNQEALHLKDNCDPNKMSKKTSSFKINYPDLKKKVTKYSLNKISANKSFHDIKTFKDNESLSKKFEMVLSPKIDKNSRLDSFDILDDANFSTAAGKTIQVSNTAMQAAKNLIQGVFSEENKSTCSKGINLGKNKIYKITNTPMEHIGCSSRMSIDESIDVDMDNTLVEKFFEDALFDEKELELGTECKRDENSELALVSKSDNNLSSRQQRKSLGGRRSMRYCSSKL